MADVSQRQNLARSLRQESSVCKLRPPLVHPIDPLIPRFKNQSQPRRRLPHLKRRNLRIHIQHMGRPQPPQRSQSLRRILNPRYADLPPLSHRLHIILLQIKWRHAPIQNQHFLHRSLMVQIIKTLRVRNLLRTPLRRIRTRKNRAHRFRFRLHNQKHPIKHRHADQQTRHHPPGPSAKNPRLLPPDHPKHRGNRINIDQEPRLLLRQKPRQRQQKGQRSQIPGNSLLSRGINSQRSQPQRHQPNPSRAVEIRSVIRQLIGQQQKRQRPPPQPRPALPDVTMEIQHRLRRKVFRVAKLHQPRWRRVNRTTQQHPVPRIVSAADQHRRHSRQTETRQSAPPFFQFTRISKNQRTYGQHPHRHQPGIFGGHHQAAKHARRAPLHVAFRIQRHPHRRQKKCSVQCVHKRAVRPRKHRRHGGHYRRHPPTARRIHAAPLGQRRSHSQEQRKGQEIRETRRSPSTNRVQRRVHRLRGLRKRRVAIVSHRPDHSAAQPHLRPQQMIRNRIRTPIPRHRCQPRNRGHQQHQDHQRGGNYRVSFHHWTAQLASAPYLPQEPNSSDRKHTRDAEYHPSRKIDLSNEIQNQRQQAPASQQGKNQPFPATERRSKPLKHRVSRAPRSHTQNQHAQRRLQRVKKHDLTGFP